MATSRGWESSSDEDGMAIDLDAKQEDKDTHDITTGAKTAFSHNENQVERLDYDPSEPTDEYDPSEPTKDSSNNQLGDDEIDNVNRGTRESSYDPADPTLSDEEGNSQQNGANILSENKADSSEEIEEKSRWKPVPQVDKSPSDNIPETKSRRDSDSSPEENNQRSETPEGADSRPGQNVVSSTSNEQVIEESKNSQVSQARSRSPSLAPTDTDDNTQLSFAEGVTSDVPEVTFDESDFVLEKELSGSNEEGKKSDNEEKQERPRSREGGYGSEASHNESPQRKQKEVDEFLTERKRSQEEVDSRNEEVMVGIFREESDPERIEEDLLQSQSPTKGKKKAGTKKLKKKVKKIKKGAGKKSRQEGGDVDDQRFVELRGERRSIEEGEVDIDPHARVGGSWDDLEDRRVGSDLNDSQAYEGEDREQREPGEIVEDGSKRKLVKKKYREKKRRKKSRREVATIEDGAQGDDDSQKFPSFLAGFFVQDEEGGEDIAEKMRDDLSQPFENEEENTFQKGGKTYRKRHSSGAEDSVRSEEPPERTLSQEMRAEDMEARRRSRGREERRNSSREHRHDSGRENRESRREREREHRRESSRDRTRESERERERSRHERGDRTRDRSDRDRERERSRRGERGDREERRRRHKSRSGSRELKRKSDSAERNRRSRERAMRRRRDRSSRSQDRDRERERSRRERRERSHEREETSDRRVVERRSRSPRQRSERGGSNKENREGSQRRRRQVSAGSEERETRRTSRHRRQRRQRSSSSSSSSSSSKTNTSNRERENHANSPYVDHLYNPQQQESSDDGANSDVILVEPEKIFIDLDEVEEQQPPSGVDITMGNADDGDSTTVVDGERVPPPPDLRQGGRSSALIQITQEEEEGDATPTRDERTDDAIAKHPERRAESQQGQAAEEQEGDYDPAHPTEEPEDRPSGARTPETAAPPLPSTVAGPPPPSEPQPPPPAHPPHLEVRPSPPPQHHFPPWNRKTPGAGLLPTPDIQPLYPGGTRQPSRQPAPAIGPLAQLTSLLPGLDRARMAAAHQPKPNPLIPGRAPLLNSSGPNLRGAAPQESTEMVDMDMSPNDDDCELELPSPTGSDRDDRRRRRKEAQSGGEATTIQPATYLKALSKVIERLTPKVAPQQAQDKQRSREHRRRRQPVETMAEDDVPASAVDLTNKEKYLKKLHLQERVIDEVKTAIKPFYSAKKINKDQYKLILRKAVPKVCHSKSERINPQKIQQLVEAYVEKLAKGGSLGGGPPGKSKRKKGANSNNPAAKEGATAQPARQNGDRAKKAASRS